MILQGKNLIILVNGSVIAPAKSCTLNVDCEKIKVSVPNSQTSVPGMDQVSIDGWGR